ncbi:MAG: hypothetical protein WHF31_15265 [Candidatus Dehalobacter alkaniphilus]
MRIGIFKVPEKMLKSKRIDQKFYVHMLFTGLFITESTYIKAEDKVMYKAIGEQFDDVNDGDTIPEYEVLIEQKNNKAIFKRMTL